MVDLPESAEPAPAPDAFAGTAIGRRLYKLASTRFEPGESAIAWCRVWVSRDGRGSSVVAARHRDFAVVTDRRLMLWSCGFFTRRPRRRVLTDRRDDLTVNGPEIPRGFQGRFCFSIAFSRTFHMCGEPSPGTEP